ncbi:MAG: OmpA family protein [Rhizobiales bacterium]|nr:OmpA family protein [Hyphomicrobiales bacterium]
MHKLTGNFKTVRFIAMVGAMLSVTTGFAIAGEVVTEDQIVRALSPKTPLTRGLSVATPADETVSTAQGKFIDSLRNRPTRSLSAGERDQLAEITEAKPNIDMEITFDYNSATISAEAQPAIQALGKALSNPNFKGSTFVVAGHTDAAGGEAYNQDLSERRADSVKRYLVEKFGLAGADLVTVGYGKSRLKDAAHPLDAANRRVQVVNMVDKTASK